VYDVALISVFSRLEAFIQYPGCLDVFIDQINARHSTVIFGI